MSNKELYLVALESAQKVSGLLELNGQVTSEHVKESLTLTRMQMCALTELCHQIVGGERGRKGD